VRIFAITFGASIAVMILTSPPHPVPGGGVIAEKLKTFRSASRASAQAIFYKCAWAKGVCTIMVREKLPPRLLLNQSPMVLVSRISAAHWWHTQSQKAGESSNSLKQ